VHVPLRTGETLFERFEVHAVAPAERGLLQARARDRSTGQWVQLVAPDRTARLRPGSRARFQASSAAPAADGVLPREDVGEHKGVPLAVREDGIRPLPAGARMSARDAWAALRHLAPAVQASALALGGELDGRDLVLDAAGRLLLAPSGIVRAESLSALPHHRAPEAWDQTTPTASAALYGLGVLLFAALAGEPPVAARGRGGLREGQARPRPLKTLVPETPDDLAAAIDGLVSPDPMVRMRAAASLPPGEAARPAISVPAISPPTRPAPRTADPSRTATTRGASAAEDRALLGWLVVADVAGSTRAARRRLAALAELDPAVVEAAHAADEPLPIFEGLRNEASARAAMLPLEASGVALRTQLAPDAPTGRRVAALGLGGAGLLGLIGAIAMLPLGLVFGLMAGLPSLALIAGATFLAASAQRDRALLTRLSSAARRRDAAAELPPARAKLAAARRAVLAPHVPDAVRVDLDGALDELEDALDADPEGAATEVEAAAGRIGEAVVTGGASPDLRERVDEAERRAHAAAAALRGRVI
jgi:hypothetical protein